jgi:RNA polymerase sigma-70 factor (ECF subfamily)
VAEFKILEYFDSRECANEKFYNPCKHFLTIQSLIIRTKGNLLENELQLIEQAREGDKTAFRVLVDEYKKAVYFLAFDLTKSKEDAEDASQEVFIKVYRSLKNFRGDSKFSSWLYRITVNTCFSLKKKKSYSQMTTKDEIDEVVDGSDYKTDYSSFDPERTTESGFIQEHIEKALDKLSKQEKTVFILRNYNGLSFNEIVEIMNLQPTTVRGINFRALKKLRKELAFYKQN